MTLIALIFLFVAVALRGGILNFWKREQIAHGQKISYSGILKKKKDRTSHITNSNKLEFVTLETKKLVKKYPKFRLQKIDLKLPKGQVLGLVGPNGAGKSTIINILAGLLKPDAGEVLLFGTNIEEAGSNIRSKIGLVRDETYFADDVRVRYLLNFASQVYPNWDNSYLSELINVFQIDINKKFKELSKGTKVKLNIILALSHKAELLLLDEPYAGLDLIAKKELTDLLQRGIEKLERAILISSHNINEIEKLCNNVVLLSGGKVIVNEAPQELQASWQKVEFQTENHITVLNNVKQHWRTQQTVTWILETGGFEVCEYLTKHGAKNISIPLLSLEEIFTILIEQGWTQNE